MLVAVGQLFVGLFLLALVGAVVKKAVRGSAYRRGYRGEYPYHGYGNQRACEDAYRAGYRRGRVEAQRGYDYPRYY